MPADKTTNSTEHGMDFLPGNYQVNGATWFYLSLLLIVAVFFRFNRIWSLRNLDLALLVSLAPGLLLIKLAEQANSSATVGYVWLFVVTGILLLRLYADGWLQRRPKMEQNLNAAGLGFLCVAAFVFLMTEMITAGTLPDSTVRTVDRAEQLLHRKDKTQHKVSADTNRDDPKPGPAAPILTAPAVEMSKMVVSANGHTLQQTVGSNFADMAARLTAILAHLAVIVALLLVGYWHFGDFRLGLAMATLYLLLPSTSYDVGKVNHVLPAALITWAVVAFRRPVIAGCLIGLACGTLVFPVFLLPLWFSFYGRRGWLRFGGAVVGVAVLLAGSLALTSADTHSFSRQIIGSIDWNAFEFRSDNGGGFWNSENAAYRVPVGAVFLVMLLFLVVRPRKKNLGHLLAHSAAIVVGIQFWYPRHGGEFVLWYLPLTLMVVFRPRLSELLPPEQSADQSAIKMKPTQDTPEPAASLSASSRLFR